MAYMKSQLHMGTSTPNIYKSEGIAPAQLYKVPGYLALKHFDQKTGWHKVIFAGKIVALDKFNYLVPAGLLLDIETALAGEYADKAAFIAAAASFGEVYSADDALQGVKNFQGATVTANEPVVASFFTDYDATKARLNTVGNPIGFLKQDAWRSSGAGYGPDGNEAGSPADYTYENYNRQEGLSVHTQGYVEVPVSTAAAVLLKGQAIFEGAPLNGASVTFNKNSNYAVFSTPQIEITGTDVAEVIESANTVLNEALLKMNGRTIGKIMFIDKSFPKDHLEYVKTAFDGAVGQSNIERPSGTATNGLPHALHYAGVTDPASAVMVSMLIRIA